MREKLFYATGNGYALKSQMTTKIDWENALQIPN